MPHPSPPISPASRRERVPGWARLPLCGLTGLVLGSVVAVPGSWQDGLLVGWVASASVFVAWTWATIWPMDSTATRSHAAREDAGRAAADIVILAAALAGLGAVVLFLLSGSKSGAGKDIQAAISVAGVAAAWATVHTLFTTRYARLYYQSSAGGVDFNEDDPPRYSDFAYLSFTIGMTYQVSDTNLKTKEIRATALRHALLSYLLGVGIIAVTINLVAGLGK